MSEQERDKAGLHKKISSIFKGVPIPHTDDGQEPSGTPAPERIGYTEPKPLAPEPQKHETPKPYQATQSLPKAAPEHTGYIEPKQPATEPQKTEVPKAYQATQSLPKAAPEHTGYIEPKPPTPEPQKTEVPKAYQATQSLPKAAPEHTGYIEPKPPTPEPQKTEVPKAYQATQSLPKAAPEHTGYIEPKQPTPGPQKTEVPKAYQATQSLPKAAPEHTGYTEPKQPTPEPQKTEVPKAYQATQSLPKAAPEHTGYIEPKPPTPEPQKPQSPKPYQVIQSLPKSTGAQRPKADIGDIEKNVSGKRTIVTISSQTFWQQITNKLLTPKPGVSATKQKAMVVMVPLLFIVLIFMLRGVFGTSVRKTEASAEDNAPIAATADSNTKIDWEIPAPYPTTLRDPMRLGPVTTTQAETEVSTIAKLIVKSILYTEDNQSAVIGNQIMHEGEEIRGATIVKINKDRVEFEMNGKRWTQKVQR